MVVEEEKEEKEERQERVRLQRLVEDQIRLKDVYPKEWERIPKKYVLVKKTLVSCKQVIQLPPYVPKLVEEVSFSRRKGIGPDRQTLSKQVQERKVLEKRINCLEKKQTILNEAVCMLGQQVEVVQTEKELALLFEMVKQIEDDLHTTVHGCKIVQQEYQHLFQKYPYLKTERFSNRFIAQQVDVIMNSQKKLEQINRRCVQQQANLQEQKKAITVKKKMAVDILQSTEKKEKN